MELIMLNTAMVGYLLLSIYQLIAFRDTMADGAYHHKLSHFYIVLFFLIAVNLYTYRGYVIPLVFAFLHMVQHVMKEDLRLIKTNRWTKDVADA